MRWSFLALLAFGVAACSERRQGILSTASHATSTQSPVAEGLRTGEIRRILFILENRQRFLGDEIIGAKLLLPLLQYSRTHPELEIRVWTDLPELYQLIDGAEFLFVENLRDKNINDRSPADAVILVEGGNELFYTFSRRSDLPYFVDASPGNRIDFFRKGTQVAEMNFPGGPVVNHTMRKHQISDLVFGLSVDSEGAPWLKPSMSDRIWADRFVDEHFPANQAFLLLNAYARKDAVGADQKGMTEESWAEVIGRLRNGSPELGLVVGTATAPDDIAPIEHAMQLVTSAGKTGVVALRDTQEGELRGLSLSRFIAVASHPRCRLGIGLDTGTNQHLLSAAGVPNLVLFNSDLPTQSPDRWGVPMAPSFIMYRSFGESTANDIVTMTEMIIGIERGDIDRLFEKDRQEEAKKIISRLYDLSSELVVHATKRSYDYNHAQDILINIKNQASQFAAALTATREKEFLLNPFDGLDSQSSDPSRLGDSWFNSNLYKFAMLWSLKGNGVTHNPGCSKLHTFLY